MIYRIIDIFFVFFHSFLVLFNLLGWMWKRTRFFNLIALGLTGSSWLILGLFVGTLGYCPFTDWHFNVLEKLGESNLPNSYIKYLTERLIGFDVKSYIVDSITFWAFIASLIISLILNLRDYYRKKS